MVTIRTQAEAELGRLEGRPDPDRWASAVTGWQQQEMPFEMGYALMREAEATLEAGRDRSRAARALNDARVIADRLGAVPLRKATDRLAARAGIGLDATTGASRLRMAQLSSGLSSVPPESRPRAASGHPP